MSLKKCADATVVFIRGGQESVATRRLWTRDGKVESLLCRRAPACRVGTPFFGEKPHCRDTQTSGKMQGAGRARKEGIDDAKIQRKACETRARDVQAVGQSFRVQPSGEILGVRTLLRGRPGGHEKSHTLKQPSDGTAELHVSLKVEVAGGPAVARVDGDQRGPLSETVLLTKLTSVRATAVDGEAEVGGILQGIWGLDPPEIERENRQIEVLAVFGFQRARAVLVQAMSVVDLGQFDGGGNPDRDSSAAECTSRMVVRKKTDDGVVTLITQSFGQGGAVCSVTHGMRNDEDIIETGAESTQRSGVLRNQSRDSRLRQSPSEKGKRRPRQHEITEPVIANDEQRSRRRGLAGGTHGTAQDTRRVFRIDRGRNFSTRAAFA